MKVLRIADISSKTPGGMLHVMLKSGQALERRGHRIDYVFYEDLGAFPRTSAIRRLVSPWRVVWKVIASNKRASPYDVVEIHEPLAAPYACVRRILGLPPCTLLSHGLEWRKWQYLVAGREVYGERQSLKSRISVPLTLLSQSRLAIKHADQIIVLTEEDASFLRERFGVPLERVTRVDNGAPTDIARLSRPRETSELRLLFFGSWIERKGIRTLCGALTDLSRSQAEWRMTLAGTGVSSSRILPALEPEVRSKVRVEPHVPPEEVGSLLQNHDVLVSPSWFEGMPLTVLEAAAGGLAIVVTDISGHRQIFGSEPESKGALYVPVHDSSAISSAVLRLYLDRTLLSALQTAARKTAKGMSWAHSALQFETAYNHAVEHENARR